MHNERSEELESISGRQELIAEEVARKLISELPMEKLADAILDHPGLLDALINYSRHRLREMPPLQVKESSQ